MTRQNADIPGRIGDGSWIRVRDEDEVNNWPEIIFTDKIPDWLEKKRRKTPLS